jgi:hypothetical protein
MFCAKLVLKNIHIELLIEKHYNRHIRVSILTFTNLYVIMRPKIIKNSNLFKQQCLMHSL